MKGKKGKEILIIRSVYEYHDGDAVMGWVHNLEEMSDFMATTFGDRNKFTYFEESRDEHGKGSIAYTVKKLTKNTLVETYTVVAEPFKHSLQGV